MFNMIKMDLYRMFKTKSTYVIWIVMAAMVIFSTAMSKTDVEYLNEDTEVQQEEGMEQADDEKNINLGMEIFLPTEPGEKVTVADQAYANLSAKFVALFLLIYTVLFSSADMNSGYIKNIGGQVKNRGKLVVSKAIALLVYTVCSMLLYLGLQAAAHWAVFRYLVWGSPKEFLLYFGTQILLHYALVLIGMAIAVILNSNVMSMTIVVCLSMNVMTIFYGVLDKLIQKAGVKDFHVIEHTVTGRIAMLDAAPGVKDCMYAILVAAIFGIAVTLLSGQVFRKRDI